METKSLLDLADKYLRHLFDLNYRPNSLKVYTRYLKSDFATWVNLKLAGDWMAVDYAVVEDYVSWLRDRGLAAGSVAIMVSTVKKFWDWLCKQRMRPENPWRSVDRIRVSKKSRTKPWTKPEVLAIFAAEEDPKFKALWELLYAGGLRVGCEALPLRIRDLDFPAMTVFLADVKGGEQHEQPLTPSSVRALKAYLGDVTKLPKDRMIWPAAREGIMMSSSHVRAHLKQTLVKAGLDPEEGHPHCFRHSIATHMLEAGCDIASVQDFLRHEDIESTLKYTHFTPQLRRRNVREFHPLGQE